MTSENGDTRRPRADEVDGRSPYGGKGGWQYMGRTYRVERGSLDVQVIDEWRLDDGKGGGEGMGKGGDQGKGSKSYNGDKGRGKANDKGPGKGDDGKGHGRHGKG